MRPWLHAASVLAIALRGDRAPCLICGQVWGGLEGKTGGSLRVTGQPKVRVKSVPNPEPLFHRLHR